MHNEALLLEIPLLPADFRSLGVAQDCQYLELLKWEHMDLSRIGFMIPYQSVEGA